MCRGLVLNGRVRNARKSLTQIVALQSGPSVQPPRSAITDRRVLSVISNCTGLPVFFWTTTPRDFTCPPAATSPTFSLTRSQPRSLLLIARLKRTRFRTSPSSSSRARARIDQTSFIFNAGFLACQLACTRTTVTSWPGSRGLVDRFLFHERYPVQAAAKCRQLDRRHAIGIARPIKGELGDLNWVLPSSIYRSQGETS